VDEVAVVSPYSVAYQLLRLYFSQLSVVITYQVVGHEDCCFYLEQAVLLIKVEALFQFCG
jgi:hypothetical protein